jgi:hypothetical protein
VPVDKLWSEVFPGARVWVHEYIAPHFGQVNCVLVDLGRGELGVISPAPRLNAYGFASMDRRGKLTTIIAPNSGHQAGIVPWQARYPAAACYAPRAALGTIRQPGMRPLMALDEWRAGPGIECRELPGTRHGGTLLRVHRNSPEAGGRSVVYADEIVIHLGSLPQSLLLAAAFWLTRSAPGLRINRAYTRWHCTDAAAVARVVIDALDDRAAVIPSHGGALSEPDAGERVKAMLLELSK